MDFCKRHFEELAIISFYTFMYLLYCCFLPSDNEQGGCNFALPMFFLFYWFSRILLTLFFIVKAHRTNFKYEYYFLAILTNIIPYLF